MRPEDEKPSCDSPGCGCGPQPVSIGRRDFLAVTGLGAASMLLPDWPAVAGPFEEKDFEALVPRDKKLNPDWVRGLTERRQPEVYRGAELNWVGMPVGGIACGQLYLGGDGRLWYWDIFTSTTTTDYEAKIWAGPHYEHPLQAEAGRRAGVRHPGEAGREDHRPGPRSPWLQGHHLPRRVPDRPGDLPRRGTARRGVRSRPSLRSSRSTWPTRRCRRRSSRSRSRTPARAPVEVSLAGWLENAVCRDRRRRAEPARGETPS